MRELSYSDGWINTRRQSGQEYKPGEIVPQSGIYMPDPTRDVIAAAPISNFESQPVIGLIA